MIDDLHIKSMKWSSTSHPECFRLFTVNALINYLFTHLHVHKVWGDKIISRYTAQMKTYCMAIQQSSYI